MLITRDYKLIKNNEKGEITSLMASELVAFQKVEFPTFKGYVFTTKDHKGMFFFAPFKIAQFFDDNIQFADMNKDGTLYFDDEHVTFTFVGKITLENGHEMNDFDINF